MITTDSLCQNPQTPRFLQHSDHTALILPGLWPVLSSAVLNGGLTQVHSLLNLRVDASAPPPWPPAQDTLTDAARQLQLPAPVAGMMTAASMRSLGYASSGQGHERADCWVTAGLANLRRPADAADAGMPPGTINIWLLLHQPLTTAAMAEALIQLTEAKVTAIRDLNLLSPVSGLPASGTGTDSHAVICPPGPARAEFCGKHTAAGEHIGRAVLSACRISLELCLRAARG